MTLFEMSGHISGLNHMCNQKLVKQLKAELFEKKVSGTKLFTIFAKCCMLDVAQGSLYTYEAARILANTELKNSEFRHSQHLPAQS